MQPKNQTLSAEASSIPFTVQGLNYTISVENILQPEPFDTNQFAGSSVSMLQRSSQPFTISYSIVGKIVDPEPPSRIAIIFSFYFIIIWFWFFEEGVNKDTWLTSILGYPNLWCGKEYHGSSVISYENLNEVLGEDVILIEKAEYRCCTTCNNLIALYHKFNK